MGVWVLVHKDHVNFGVDSIQVASFAPMIRDLFSFFGLCTVFSRPFRLVLFGSSICIFL